MAIQVTLNHRTRYSYDRLVNLGPHVVRLRPAPHCRTKILSYSMKVLPAQHFINWQQDPHSNYLARVMFPEKARELEVEVDLIAELAPINAFDYFLEPEAETYPFRYSPALDKDLEPYFAVQPGGMRLQRFLDSVSRQQVPTVSFLVDLNRRVQDEIAYVQRAEPGIQTCEETLEKRSGSCRDSSWLLVQILRHLGLAARFVSGYLIQLAPDVKPVEGPAGASADFSDLHAWAEVYLPGAGWIGLDPTSALVTAEGHIPLACTPTASDAAPITGTVEECAVSFSHSMSVQRINEEPRASKPYSDGQWRQIQQLAHRVDVDLAAGDVRLTMGGEPTFVGTDEPDSPQWNGAALGQLKLARALTLVRRLQERLAPGALLHFGQGKWYPGDRAPRWALNCYWRSDGLSIWNDLNLIAHEEHDYGFTNREACRFIEALAHRLQVTPQNILPAFEDVFYYAWKERRLPINVDVGDSKLAEAYDREQLARVFEVGFADPVGYVLPLRRRHFAGHWYWSSKPWFLRPERLFLVPGDLPVGNRLPLDSLPWVAPEDIEYDYEVDPFAQPEPLPAKPARRMDLFETVPPLEDPKPEPPLPGESAKDSSRPALCVQVRDGRLYVFLPYTRSLRDYLDLVTAVEDTCAYLEMPVWLEGYTPPAHPHVNLLQVTPDPGVIEVNLPPSRSWDELENLIETVYCEARHSRLTTEKFMFQGQQTVTGGGSHIVIGGATPADSPILRGPDLLRSMVAFWQNHPSLSYLFSGMFIGPTSQYPRVDEARMDSVYELEIAFNQLPSGPCSPWLVDRLFRNLLVDVTGNTHRSEFCIDKLYPPEGAGSRLGLLELRAFEMPPHARMSLTLLLLIRALVAMFWSRPFEGKLIPWGTALHDRFLLPHFLIQDFHDVLATLRQFGYAFSEDWFAPQIEFRFPKIGSVAIRGIEIELRQALEPWHVLAEDVSQGAPVRTVDSSLDRLQVKVSGLTESRYTLACNGRRVPLHPTGRVGEAVAGVRYRAWQLQTCLHPTIPVHAPLVFDIVDEWNGRSLGGCTYHVAHPGGRSYSARPINSYEAESRRLARFEESGHTPGPMVVPEEASNPVLPMTLDLRRPASFENKYPADSPRHDPRSAQDSAAAGS